VAVENAFARPKTLVFDTGPLWELILYRCMEEGFRRGLKRQFLREKTHYDRLANFLDMFPKKTTTAHVVAEISGHIKRGVAHRKEDIWKIVFEEFAGMRMSEHLIKLLDMREQVIGVDQDAVDASVLQLGLNLREENPTVFTTEDTLVNRCKSVRLPVTHIYEAIWG
jgi:hypothetical protein